MEYNFFADLLNKYSQFTPWVQVALGAMGCGVLLGMSYFFKETVVAIVSPFSDKEKKPKKEWHDKYYRDENIKA
jgi:hypothetical protein